MKNIIVKSFFNYAFCKKDTYIFSKLVKIFHFSNFFSTLFRFAISLHQNEEI